MITSFKKCLNKLDYIKEIKKKIFSNILKIQNSLAIWYFSINRKKKESMYRVAFNILFSFFHENENILKSHSIAI